ncbi:amidohydrolase family protein [Actinokineospora enzanensis]|uniref:amidohydrolase family protein n=1 Tax=Actinokineospora enzanensis TaxID=155975 RepID=UPI000361A71F|nr:amidohydrolase family protein [Actinokineospora enzanensis]
MIIDAHHHLWDPAARAYPRAADQADPPRHGMADLPTVLGDRVRAAVLVQSVASAAETEEFLAVAEASDLVAGVVGWLDLTDPGLGDRLDRLRERPLVGLRHPARDEPDHAWLLRSDVRAGLATLAERGLTYDIVIRPSQRPAALALARLAGGAPTLVVDHLGSPWPAAGEWEPWASWIGSLARCDNVVCKLSGIDGPDLGPYVDHVLAEFGPDRVLFGSDWPVGAVDRTYGDLLDLTESLLDKCTPKEHEAVLSSTARRVYRLPD